MKYNQSGQISRTLIILAVVVLLAIAVIYGVLTYGGSRQASIAKEDAKKAVQEPPKPVYETTAGSILFLVGSAVNLGSVVKAQSIYQQDLKTTEKFIKVTILAQNKGKADTAQYLWNVGNIVDSEGRNFTEDPGAYYFIPQPDSCGAILKPEFTPTSCVKYYQVSKASTHLKIQVSALDPNSSKKQEAFLDLNVR